MFVLAILLGFFCTTPLTAAQKTPLQKYISYSFYKQKILNTASAYALTLDECAKRNAIVSRERYDLISPPVFREDKFHPVAGAWYETVTITQCLKTHKLLITVIADEDGKMPQFVVKLPEAPAQ